MTIPITQVGNPRPKAPSLGRSEPPPGPALPTWCPPLACQPHLSALVAFAGRAGRRGLAERSDLIKAADRIALLPLLAPPEAKDARVNSQDVTDAVLLCLASSPARCEVS